MQKGVMHLYTNVGIKARAASSGKPVLRKYISVKLILSSWIVVCFIIQWLSKLRIRETDLLWKIFLKLGVILCYKFVLVTVLLLWSLSIQENYINKESIQYLKT